MSKTTKEQREFVRDSYIESPESIALNLLDDLEAAEQEVANIDFLRGNQLAAISTVLLSNTPVSLAATKIEQGHALCTAAFQDAVRAIEREIELRHKLEAAEAEVQRLREQTQWRGIETAPKRKPVLVMCEGGQCYVLYQTDNGEGYMDNWRWHDGTAFGTWPTHWMPLTQPPQAQESDGARCA